MNKKVPYKPAEYHDITPYMIVRDVDGLIGFLKEVFNAELHEHMKGADGRIMHAEVRIGDSFLMMGGATEQYPAFPAMMYVYTEDTDAVYQRAIKAGGISLQEPADQFYGDRTAGFKDLHGNQWWLATRVEEVSRDEMERRAAAR